MFRFQQYAGRQTWLTARDSHWTVGRKDLTKTFKAGMALMTLNRMGVLGPKGTPGTNKLLVWFPVRSYIPQQGFFSFL